MDEVDLSQALVIDERQESDYPCLGNVGEEIVIQGMCNIITTIVS